MEKMLRNTAIFAIGVAVGSLTIAPWSASSELCKRPKGRAIAFGTVVPHAHLPSTGGGDLAARLFTPAARGQMRLPCGEGGNDAVTV